MWPLHQTNKCFIYALGIGAVLLSTYGAGYTYARRLYRAEIAAMRQRHTEQSLAAEQAYSAKLAEVAAEKQRWFDFAQEQSAKLADATRLLNTRTTQIKQEIPHAIARDQNSGHCPAGLGADSLRLYRRALGYSAD